MDPAAPPTSNGCLGAQGVWCAKAIKNIQIGTEITTDYGPSYFGEDNMDCECEIHIDEVERVNNSKHTKSLKLI